MPWIYETDGSLQYRVSKYAKEELPTWNELWREFWLNRVFFYDPEDPEQNRTEVMPNSDPTTLIKYIDLFWRIPHAKVLLWTVCNQLNKMLFEDGQLEATLEFINQLPSRKTKPKITDIRFAVRTDDNFDNLNEFFVGTDRMPPIYSSVLPRTKKRSIFASDYPWINVDSLTGKLTMVMLLTDENGCTSIVTPDRDRATEEFDGVIYSMLPYVEEYFRGQPGWKNEDGENIPISQPTRKCLDAGLDAGL
jgi:hypothetical protein